LAHPKAWLEAITRRFLLLASIARLTQQTGQCRLRVTFPPAASDRIETLIANIRKGLHFVLTTTPQLSKAER
jgi:hypothetical protein